MKRSRIAALLVTVVAALTLGLAGSAHAIGAQIATNQGGSSLCMNRAGGGTGAGTAVIAYNCGNQNNDFEFISPHLMCGSGFVTQNCPFTVGSGMNAALAGDQIVYEYSYNTGRCLGGATQTDVTAKLETCPDANGNGGWSTIYVAQPTVITGGVPYNVLINRNWSDINYANQQKNPPPQGACNGLTCVMNLSTAFPTGYRNPLALNAVDSFVQAGNWNNIPGNNQWGEV